MTAAATGSTSWETARAAARAARAAFTTGETSVDADTLLGAALDVAHLRLFPLPPNDPLLSGAHAVLDPEAGAVWVRADAPPEDRRLYVAHELAHFYLHAGGEVCTCDDADFADADSFQAVGYGPRQRRETEANVFAREFLLPVAPARRFFAEEGLNARVIADRCGVPLGVVYAQLAEGLTSNGGGEPPPVETTATKSPPLDPSQAAAAYAEQGPLLVGAGPGTGKTRTLTARVLFLTRERGVRPDSLLALTFSRKAAEEMRERIGAEAPDVAQRAAITTFHSYGFDLLRRHGRAASLPPNPILLEMADACALLERRAATLGLSALRYLHDPAFPLPDILRMIGRAKEDLLTPEAFAALAEELDNDRVRDVARVFAAYEALLREKGALDFADLICRAVRLLDNDDVRHAEQAQWQHILVDEYQDVNRAGALLVRALSGSERGVGLWAVGDIRQAIYRFRGASPANVSRFGIDFPGGHRTDLRVNYRSRPELVRLFGRASGEGEMTWQAARVQDASDPTTCLLAVADDDTVQADHIAARMRAFMAAGYHLGDQVVLCRTRGQARAMRAALTARGVPVAVDPQENSLLASPDVKDLLALLSRACEPEGPARHRWPDLPPGVSPPAGGDAYGFWTDALWGTAGLARGLRGDPAAVGQLLALARTYRDRAPALLEDVDDPCRSFLRHIRRMARLGASFGTRDGGDAADSVRVLTVHASKGLEFPVVFVPNLSAGKFPSRPGPGLLPALPDEETETADSESDEEARLFFVALTRARDHLILSRAQKYGRISAKPSPLLTCLDDAPELKHATWEALPNGAKVAEDVPSAPALSGEASVPVTAADAELYLRCPRRYWYERVLGLPGGERMPYAGFKRAVAAALATSDPVKTLDDTWHLKGPDPRHPHTPLYRQAAGEIVTRAAEGVARGPWRSSRDDAPPTLTLALENGTITVQPDAVEAEGSMMEYRTFRKPPSGEDASEAPGDRLTSLLREASGAAAPATVQIRYLQSGQVLPVADKPKQRAKHLAEYETALRGIRLQMFPPAPAEDDECPVCPYFFICPG